MQSIDFEYTNLEEMRKVKSKLLFMLVVLTISSSKVKAQYFPYNPYNNPGYVLGQQIGSAIRQNVQRNSKYGRNQLRKAIKKWGECNNGSLSLEYGAVAVYGSNGYFCSASVDDRISSKLRTINKSEGNITDINILENGKFIIVYNNGKDWYGVIPTELETALNSYSYGTKFKSISFNESGTYAITTSDGFSSNNSVYQSFYDDNIDEFGDLLSVNICGDGAVFCFSDKTRYCGRIPDVVESGIHSFSGTANFVKFNKHGDYLICSKNGSYSYSIGDADAGGNASTIYYDYEKERWEIAKKRASETWKEEISYFYKDSTHLHRVHNLNLEPGNLNYITTEIICNDEVQAAPTIFFGFTILDEEHQLYDFCKNFTVKEENVEIKILLSNGETISTTKGFIVDGILGVDVGGSLVSYRSDKKYLSGDLSSINYLIRQLSLHKMMTISFKGFTINVSHIDMKGQLLCGFIYLAEKSGHMNWLPDK